MKKTIVRLICFLFFSILQGQNHQLIDTTDFKKRDSLTESFKLKYSLFNKRVKKDYKGKMRKSILSSYQESQKQFLEIIKNKKLLLQEDYQNYIDSLYIGIKNNNDALKNKEATFLMTKNPNPNAFSIGDGTFLINVGLFSFLENEYQVLSVMAHELAHELLEHARQKIEKRAHLDTEVLSETAAATRRIKAEKYNRGSRSLDLLKNLMYAEGRERRQNEIQADSLGYILYKRTGAPKAEFLNALLKLKEYDSLPSIKVDSATYFRVFDIPEQPFNKTWLTNEDFDDYNYDFYESKINLDSLKGHPELNERILTLKSYFPELNTNDEDVSPANETFKNLKLRAYKASVENYFYLEDYGLSIYLILNRIEDDYSNQYLKTWLGLNFKALYEAKKKYQLNRYVDRVVPNEQTPSYQMFLNFIWNLNLEEMKKIAEYYTSS